MGGYEEIGGFEMKWAALKRKVAMKRDKWLSREIGGYEER